jgi:predicted aspartyl protease
MLPSRHGHILCWRQDRKRFGSRQRASIPKLLVDIGSEYTWVAGATLEKLGIKREKKDLAFIMANGQLITRSVGFAIVRVDKAFTVDEVVFAEKRDMLLLGARSLEGLNLAVDSRKKKLVAAGPLPVAATLRQYKCSAVKVT